MAIGDVAEEPDRLALSQDLQATSFRAVTDDDQLGVMTLAESPEQRDGAVEAFALNQTANATNRYGLSSCREGREAQWKTSPSSPLGSPPAGDRRH